MSCSTHRGASEVTDMRDMEIGVCDAASSASPVNVRLGEASANANTDAGKSVADVGIDGDSGMSTEMTSISHNTSIKNGMDTVVNVVIAARDTSQIDRQRIAATRDTGGGGRDERRVREEGTEKDRASDSSKEQGNMDLRKVSPIACTSLWIALGISMIMFNKKILAPRSQGGWNFGHPFFLTMLHQGFATFATILLDRFTPLLASVKERRLSTAAYWKNVTPLSFFFSLGLVLGNCAYKYLSVSYIQMIKSCLPIPTLFVTYLIGRETPTVMQVLLVCIICVGAVMASLGEMHFSVTGFILQGCALCADVGRMVFLDQLTQEVKLDNLSTLYYMAPLSCGFIFIGFMIFEYSTFHGTYYTYQDPLGADPALEIIEYYPWYFPLLLLANGILAFALNLSIVLLVTNAGIMAMTLAGILKDVLVVILSVFLFGAFSKVTDFQVVGYGISLTGLTLYKELKKPDGGVTRWLARVAQTLEHASRRISPTRSECGTTGLAGQGEDEDDRPLLHKTLDHDGGDDVGRE